MLFERLTLRSNCRYCILISEPDNKKTGIILCNLLGYIIIVTDFDLNFEEPQVANWDKKIRPCVPFRYTGP
jgi:hypothetical protein